MLQVQFASHRSSDCPQRKMANILEGYNEEKVEDYDDLEEFEGEEMVVMEDEGEQVNCVIQRVLLSAKQPITSKDTISLERDA